MFHQPPRPLGGSPPEIAAIQHAVVQAGGWVEPLHREIGRVLVGQHALVDRLIVALLAGGHVLLEGGAVTVDSAPDRGSTFTVSLPT